MCGVATAIFPWGGPPCYIIAVSKDPYQNRKIRFGIVGCGAIGPTHAGAIQQMADTEVVAVADVIPLRASDLAAKFSVSKVYGDQHELFSDPNIDVVCLCTPSGLHGDGAVDAMLAGKHVVVEKPMEISTAACDRMIATQQQTNQLLAIISQHRFDAASMLLKDVISSGKLGRIILATASVKWWRTQKYYDEGDWRGTWALDGGGAVMNQGIHTIDLLQWLAGEIDTVYAQTRTAAHERIEVEDAAVAALTFKSGAIGTYVASTAVYDGLPVRIDIFGTEGTAILEGDRLKQLKLKSGEVYTTEAAAQHAVRVASGGTSSVADEAAHRAVGAKEGAVWGDAHRAQLEDFVRALRTGGKPLIDGLAGRASVQIIQGIYESAKGGKAVKL
jgi:UDP-N-acetyl-2-amino-2-deoxyglucuronate dehydrogenase